MPANAVYVGRPTRFGNDWTLRDAAVRGLPTEAARRAWVIAAYRRDMENWTHGWAGQEWREAIASLRGKDIACWCPLVDKDGNPVACHADVLLELANAPQETP